MIFKRITLRLALMVAVLSLFLTPDLSMAQGDLGQTYSSEDGSLTFQYPTDWVVTELDGQVLIGNSEEAATALSEQGVLAAGQVAFGVLVIQTDQVDITPEMTPDEIAAALSNEADLPPVEEIVIEDAPAFLLLDEFEGQDRLVVFRTPPGEEIIVLVAVSGSGEMAQYQETMVAIFGTVIFDAEAVVVGVVTPLEADALPALVAGTPPVVWQMDFSEAPLIIEALGADADDTLYLYGANSITLRREWILVDAAGLPIQAVSYPARALGLGAVTTIAPDGTYWLLAPNGQDTYDIYQLDAEGNRSYTLLTNYGAPFSLRNSALGVDAAGNVYLYDSDSRIVVGFTRQEQVFTYPLSTDAPLTAKTFGPDGIFYSSDGTTIIGQQPVTGEIAFEGTLPEGISVAALAAGPNGLVVVGGDNGTLYLFDATGALVNEIPAADASAIQSLVVLSNGNVVAFYENELLVQYAPEIEEMADGVIEQWASTADGTSQYTDTSWNFLQATGEPNTFDCGDIVTAWASASSSGQESLTVGFEQAVIPTQINIYQTYNPGSIVRVEIGNPANEINIELPDSADPVGNTPCPGVFTLDISGIDTPINEVTIYLDQSAIGSWNEIDAVQLVGTPVE